jgi:hypothetical protein
MKNMLQGLRLTPSVSVLILSALLAFTACKKQPPPPPSAKGSLVQEGGGCYPFTVHGTYYNGITPPDTNYVEINVDVTSPGAYRITSDEQNGVTFSGSGVFNQTGLNVVRLKSTGAFLKDTTIDFHTFFDSTSCVFRIDTRDSAELSIADNTWHFNAGGHLYQGTGIGYATVFVGGSYYFAFYGSMTGYTDTSLIIKYMTYPTEPVSCSHLTSAKPENSFSFTTSRFASGPVVHLYASQSTVPAVLDITDCSGNLYDFNGTALDSAGNIISITNARFRVDDPQQLFNP